MTKIITGEWEGEPIYREETAEERLRKELERSGLVDQTSRLTTENKKEYLKMIRKLESKATPFNWAWKKLEDLTGYDGDRTAIDIAGGVWN